MGVEVVYKLKDTKTGRNKGDSVNIDTFNKSIIDGIILGEQRRIYRRKHQLPDPTKSPKADVNRRDTKLVVRLEQSDLDAFNEAAEEAGLTKKETLKEMIQLYRKHQGIDPPSQG